MLRQIVFFYLFFTASVIVNAQFDMNSNNSSISFGVLIHTKGEGIDINYYTKTENKIQTLWDFDLISMRHPKYKTSYNPNLPNPRPFVYGRLNRFYILRTGYGKKIVLAERTNKNNIGLYSTSSARISSGIAKPIFIDYANFDPAGGLLEPTSVKYDPANPAQNSRYILGNARYSKGFDQLKFYPGVYFKTGINFEWGNYLSDYKSVEIGITVDYFPQAPPIMYSIRNKMVFSSFYVSFAIGKTN